MTDQKPTTNGKDYWRGKIDGKLGSFDTRLENIEGDVKEIKGLLKNGSDSDKPGIISRVREITSWKGKIEKISYAIIIFIVLDMVTRFINSPTMEQLFRNVP